MANSNWKELIPFRGVEYDRNLNSYYIILCEGESQSMIAVPFSIPTPTGIGNGTYPEVIFKYSFCDSLWKKYEFQSTKAFNEKKGRFTFPKAIHNEKIYGDTDKHELAMVKLIAETSTYTIEIIQRVNELKFRTYCGGGRGIMIPDELHFFNREKHIKYDLYTQKFDLISLAAPRYHVNTNLIYVKQKIIAFTSSCTNDYWDHHYMYEYDVQKKYAQCFPIKLSKGSYCVSCTSILNEQMILISMRSNCHRKIIYIFDLKTKIAKKSNIKVLCSQSIFAVNDKRKDILVTNGWIKSECTDIYLPACIIALIQSFYSNEFLHILDDYGKHYKMEVHRILDNC